jgi:hypothetical protein
MERIRMNTKRSVTWSLVAGVVASAAMMAMPGCELLVDFDRSKIPTGMDATFPDAGETSDAPSSPDSADGTTPTDGGSDATTPLDAADAETVDDGVETSAPETGAPDTGADAPTEAASPMDSGPDAIADAGIDGD